MRIASANGSPSARAQLLGRPEPPQRAFQPFAVDLDPLAAQQHQAVGAGEQRPDLASLRVSPSSVMSTAKSSSASSPSLEGARVPTVAVTCGRAGRPARQVAGMRTTTPALFQLGGTRQEL